VSGSAIPVTQPTDDAVTLARVAVVIVTYRSAATIDAALGTLPLEELGATVVVDNCSDDDTCARVREHAVTLVVNEANTGFGAACNSGLAWLAENRPCDFVLFLNPDATIERRDLTLLIDHLEATPSCAVVGPRLHRDGEPLSSAGRRASLLTELRLVAPVALARRLPTRRYAPGFDVTGPVGYVEGACFLARRSALEAVGGFDERYFLFYEELDLAHRLAAAGWSVDLCAAARATHAVAHSRATVEHRGKRHLLTSAERYLRRWHGPAAAAAFRLAHRATRKRRGL
jgi:N-acetylglucosaminyl-diphospho-decaprenol L-rhamnosyltransferase